MARLIKILAASLGGGLVMGAGIRIGEALASRESTSAPPRRLAERLDALENRLAKVESSGPETQTAGFSSLGERIESQAAEVSEVRERVAVGNLQIASLGELSNQLRSELRGWIEHSVDARMTEVEARLRAEGERSQKETLDAFVESVQTRVTHRISRLEEQVAGQSAGMAELRELSLRTEQSMQRLLGGLDRLIMAQPGRPASQPGLEPGMQSEAETGPPSTEPEEPPRRPRRWGFFK
jgi:chromosome segregation ATPase